MSKNTTNVIIDYTKEYNTEIILIPSAICKGCTI